MGKTNLWAMVERVVVEAVSNPVLAVQSLGAT
jgi:hypothetical protein